VRDHFLQAILNNGKHSEAEATVAARRQRSASGPKHCTGTQEEEAASVGRV